MKIEGGRTIYNNKNGDIAYESKPKKCHLVNIYNSENCPKGVAIKLEERFRRYQRIPIRNLSELQKLSEAKPFSFPKGKPKYIFYCFKKETYLQLSPKIQKRVLGFLKSRRTMGLQEAFRLHNGSRDMTRILAPFVITRYNLDEYWRMSFLKFMGNPISIPPEKKLLN